MTDYDVVVVGGGPAGLSAASEAASRGARTLLIDEGAVPGGRLRFRRYSGAGTDGGPVDAAKLGEFLIASARSTSVEIWTETVVWGVWPGFEVGVRSGRRAEIVNARRLVLATGETDLARSFQGSDSPGVMTGGGLLRMVRQWGVWPGGRRIAIIGDDRETGDDIERLASERGGTIVLRTNASPVVHARDGVVAAIQESVHSPRIEVDIVAICAGSQPDIGLALMLECETGYSAELGGFVPFRSRYLETSVPGVFVCGGTAGAGDIDTHVLEGGLAGAAVARSLGYLIDDRPVEEMVERLRYRASRRVEAADPPAAGWKQHYVESVRAGRSAP